MMDDLRQLRYLVALGSHSTLSEAADSLGITKSALSQSIQRIEDIYGVQLFLRGRRGIQITTYGEMLVESARQSIEIFTQTSRQLDLIRNFETGRLVIGCDPVISEVLLSRALVRMLQSYPKLRYVLKSGFWTDHQNPLDAGDIDFFIGIKPSGNIAEFDLTDITLPGIVIYCRHGHPLTGKKNIILDDIYDYPILGPSMPEWFYGDIDRQFGPDVPDARNRRDLFLLTNDEGSMREIVRQSDAVSGGFRILIRADLDAGKLVVLPIRSDPFCKPIPCIIAASRRRLLPPAASVIIGVLREVAAELVRQDMQTEH